MKVHNETTTTKCGQCYNTARYKKKDLYMLDLIHLTTHVLLVKLNLNQAFL